MKKFIVFFWVFIVVLSALPANSFADQQNNLPLMFWKQGAITNLGLPFAPPLRNDINWYWSRGYLHRICHNRYFGYGSR